MKGLKVEEVIKATKGELIQGDLKKVCETFSKDTRKIEKGNLYIGIKGETFDGNLFWKQALEKGAIGVLVQGIEFTKQELEEFSDRIIIQVKDTLEALYAMASYKRSLYHVPVIAITGSVGKTSTKDIVASVVSQKYQTLKTIGNNNNNIGLPFTILRMDEEEAMVLEMGMNHFGEIRLLSQIARPTICVITNIGTSHIGILGSRENILKAKLEILEGTENPTIIINQDNDLLAKWYKANQENKNIVTYGIESISDLQAKDITLEIEKSSFTCQLEGKDSTITVPVGGEHFVSNALCAAAIGETLQMKPEEIIKGIEKFELTKKRMELLELKNGINIINDAYNASFESIEAIFKYLEEIKTGKKIAVLGDILELGDYAKELHEKVGKAVYDHKIDFLICSGENAKYIAKEAKKQGMQEENVFYFENKEEIIEQLKKIAKSGDIILFKASNGMKFYDLAEKMKTIF